MCQLIASIVLGVTAIDATYYANDTLSAAEAATEEQNVIRRQGFVFQNTPPPSGQIPADCSPIYVAPPTYDATWIYNVPTRSGYQIQPPSYVLSPPYVECWLSHNTNVRDAIRWETSSGSVAFTSWTSSQRKDFREAFSAIWYWMKGGMVGTNPLLLANPPQNIVASTLADDDYPTTVISASDAWPLFVSTVAFSLVMELGAYVPWSMTADDAETLKTLFDSTRMFLYHSTTGGYEVSAVSGRSLPASPTMTYQFLKNQGAMQSTRLGTLGGLMTWGRKYMDHFLDGYTASNAVAHWGYRGAPPAQRVMDGTFNTWEGGSWFGNWTAGCHGTNGFMRSVMRVVNVAVFYTTADGHATPYFQSEYLYLSHGDDVYNALVKSIPPFAMTLLPISQSKYDSWFGAGVSSSALAANVGRSPVELAVNTYSKSLLDAYCSDVAAPRKTHETGTVAAIFADFYSVDFLEKTQLWQRLADEVTLLGGCGVPIVNANNLYYP